MKNPPVILSTSINSGTTLLGPILEYLLDRQGYYHKRMLPTHRVTPHPNFFRDMEPNEFTFQHYPHATVKPILGNPFYKVLFLIRDPRDIMVSHHKYQCTYTGPDMTDYMKAYRAFLESEGLDHKAAINRLVTRKGFTFEMWGKTWYPVSPSSLAEVITPWVQEAKKGGCRIIRFEDLTSDMFNTVKNITDYIGLPVSMEEVETACYARDVFLREGRKRGEEKEGSFYRSGASRQWEKYLTDEAIAVFNSVMGDVLKDLGYV